MKREEYDAFVQSELDFVVQQYADGKAGDLPEALLVCRDLPPKPGKQPDKSSNRLLMVMPGLDQDQVRTAVRILARKHHAYLARIKLEVWSVRLPEDADPGTRAKVDLAERTHTFHLLDPPLRGEAVMVWVEAEEFPVRLFRADLLEERRKLRPWEEAKLKLPCPGFKKYLDLAGRPRG